MREEVKKELIKKCEELAFFCREHCVPFDTIACGVAPNGTWVKSNAFQRGIQAERNRIENILGLGKS